MECYIVVIVKSKRGVLEGTKGNMATRFINSHSWGVEINNIQQRARIGFYSVVDLKFHQFAFINNKLFSELEERLINMASGAQRTEPDISISASKHKT